LALADGGLNNLNFKRLSLNNNNLALYKN
jgi:hypothetical protein